MLLSPACLARRILSSYPTLKPQWLYSHDQHRLLSSSAALGHRHPVMVMWLHAGRDMVGGEVWIGGGGREVCGWGLGRGGSWVRSVFEGLSSSLLLGRRCAWIYLSGWFFVLDGTGERGLCVCYRLLDVLRTVLETRR